VWRSADTGALLPAELVTRTSTAPGACAGARARTSGSETTWMTARVVPKSTPVVSSKPEPLIVTHVPPALGPLDGSSPV